MPARTTRNRSSSSAVPRLFRIQNLAGAVPTIQLFGDIGLSSEPDYFWGDEGGAGTFKEFCDQLAALGNVPALRVEIHSFGGSSFVGKAIHDRLAEHPAEKTAVIYGVCASAATYPALACQHIQIPANAFFIIHNNENCCCGDAGDMQQMADSLDKLDENLADLYAAYTGLGVDEIRAIMDEERWLSGDEAVAMGFATEVIEPVAVKPADRLPAQNFSRALNTMPDTASVWFDKLSLASARRTSANQARNAIMNTAPAAPTTPAAPAAVAAPAPAAAAVPAAVPPAAPAAAVNVVAAPAAAVPPVAAPTNVVPSPVGTVDLAALIANTVTTAVTTAVAPLNVKITEMENRIAQGILPQNLGGAAPAASVVPSTESGAAPVDMKNMTAAQLINLGRKNNAAARKPETVPA